MDKIAIYTLARAALTAARKHYKENPNKPKQEKKLLTQGTRPDNMAASGDWNPRKQ